MLQQIPVPLVALPPNCSQEPWWLAYIAHEVGHHVQADYLRDARLIEIFAEVLTAAGGERWGGWGQEIFADVFSLLAIGYLPTWSGGQPRACSTTAASDILRRWSDCCS
jgi:hypothetical protein